ncbi:AraC family transcriptional regulator [Gracilibacillus salinarum]|uniref:AraC family transcriptional regulator n=1 Tax=Gracilibacillus salinarum TaxID=2932255 RepID=A0ABY4GRV4_9BACI|nr:AraC family transcriptional regulator [Gracilibacillus salinarum]UOQ86926.1 AraC family transcriptional regulator [Gracilibacillus salinarum]
MGLLRDNQLQLLWTARIDYTANSAVSLHQHTDCYQLLVVLTGNGHIFTNGKRQHVNRDSVYLFKIGDSHRFYFTDACKTIDFKFKILDRELEKEISKEQVKEDCPVAELEEFKKWHHLARHIAEDSDALAWNRIDSGFKSTFISLVEKSKNRKRSAISTAKDQGIITCPGKASKHPIVQYVEANYAAKITLNLLAEMYNYNPKYIIKIFQNEVGMPPIQYLQEVRLYYARYYLEFTSLTVTEIAESIGWTSPYFSKLFKNVEGRSPREYRTFFVQYVGKDINMSKEFNNKWRISMPKS